MGFFDLFRRGEPEAAQRAAVSASVGETATFSGLNDPAFYEFVRNGGGGMTASGASVTAKTAMKNTAVLRSVSLISYSIGMLPLHLKDRETKEVADHPLTRILHRKPNGWQTAMEFRSLLQQRALTDGSAFAVKVRSGNRITQLVPISGVRVEQNDDWSLSYIMTRKDGREVRYSQDQVFHLRNPLSEDGITGISLVKQASEAIGLALQAEIAAARLFKKGMIVGGFLRHPDKLSPEAFDRLKESMTEGEGAENAHKWKILEEGMEMAPFTASGRETQGLEQRKHQVEEIGGRVFGIPRPLLNIDDTSWGSGIDVLGQLFVRYGLNPWFEAWEQAIARDLLTDDEADRYEAKFNAGGLLRGSMKDQAEFFAKGLGSGGHQPWLHPDEPRDWLDLPKRDDLPAPPGAQTGGAINEPSQTP